MAQSDCGCSGDGTLNPKSIFCTTGCAFCQVDMTVVARITKTPGLATSDRVPVPVAGQTSSSAPAATLRVDDVAPPVHPSGRGCDTVDSWIGYPDITDAAIKINSAAR